MTLRHDDLREIDEWLRGNELRMLTLTSTTRLDEQGQTVQARVVAAKGMGADGIAFCAYAITTAGALSAFAARLRARKPRVMP